MIEFACLNCGARVSTDDDDAGDQIECPGCTIMLRVPTPIGGRLTEKRLAPTPSTRAPSLAPVETQDIEGAANGIADESPLRTHRPAHPPEEPSRGFRIEYDLVGVYGRDQMPQLEASLGTICDAAQQHLEGFPQWFQSGGLLIEVHRYEVLVGLIDLRLQLRGNLNGEPVSDSIRSHDSPGGNARSVLMRGLLGIAIANITNAIRRVVSPHSGTTRAYRKAERYAIQDLSRCLDRIVNRPRSFWDRF